MSLAHFGFARYRSAIDQQELWKREQNIFSPKFLESLVK